MLFPILGYFKVYFFRYSFVGDHFQYLASIGPVVLAGVGITGLFRFLNLKSQRVLAASAQQVSLWFCVTWRESRNLSEQRNTLALQQWRIFYAGKAHDSLGSKVEHRGMEQGGAPPLHAALPLGPGHPEPYNNLGNILFSREQGSTKPWTSTGKAILDRSDGYNNMAAALGAGRPGYQHHPSSTTRLCQTHTGKGRHSQTILGVVHARSGNMDQAINFFPDGNQISNRLTPREAYANLGNAWATKGRMGEAMAYLKQAVELDFCTAETHNTFEGCWSEPGICRRRFRTMKGPVQIDPKVSPGLFQLGPRAPPPR